jgi:hypothetical protein
MSDELIMLVARIEEVYATLDGLRVDVEAAYQAALGTVDDDDNEVVPGNGDMPEAFGPIKQDLYAAQAALGRAEEKLAAVQGHRAFRAAEVTA